MYNYMCIYACMYIDEQQKTTMVLQRSEIQPTKGKTGVSVRLIMGYGT